MVAVIPSTDFIEAGVPADPFRCSQGFDLRRKNIPKLCLGNSAKGSILLIQGKIDQLVEIGKNTYLVELGHPCDKRKLQVGVGAFQHPEKGFKKMLILLMELRILYGGQERFVIFVDEDAGLFSGNFMGSPYDYRKSAGQGICNHIRGETLFPLIEMKFHNSTKTFHAIVGFRIEIQPKNRVFGPLLLQGFQGKAGEELLSAFQVGPQGGTGEGFPKAPGPGKKVCLSLVHHPVQQGRFVYIEIAAFSKRNEILNTNGEFSSLHGDIVSFWSPLGQGLSGGVFSWGRARDVSPRLGGVLCPE